MNTEISIENFEIGSKLVLKTNGEYSMNSAFKIIEHLGLPIDDFIKGRIVEKGVEIEVDNILIKVTSSYEHIFIERISGNKNKFTQLCEDLISRTQM